MPPSCSGGARCGSQATAQSRGPVSRRAGRRPEPRPATLTHTPNPMGFLNEVLERPVNERALMLVVVGYPAPDAVVPDLHRKPLSAIATFR